MTKRDSPPLAGTPHRPFAVKLRPLLEALSRQDPPPGRLLLVDDRRAPGPPLLPEGTPPGLDGRVELLRRQDEAAGESDILMVSAQSPMQSIIEALEPEAYDFLTKPLDLDAVANRLSHFFVAPEDVVMKSSQS